MKKQWCWRCQMEIPMLNEEEFRLVQEAYDEGMDVVEVVERERARRDLPAAPRPKFEPDIREEHRAALEMYHLLTGFPETNVVAIWHHRIAVHGPPCPGCGKPLRTDEARYCPACGYGMEEMGSDPRPLLKREPEEFADSAVE